jgi:uncharacterized membrane protein YjfL (UPF0719 family)
MIKYLIPVIGFVNAMDKFKENGTSIKHTFKWGFISIILMIWTFIWFGIAELIISYELIKGNWKFETVAYTLISIMIFLLVGMFIGLIKTFKKK